jgi:hypothetical protein
MSRRYTIIVVSVLVFIAAAVWLAASEVMLVWAVNQAAHRSGGTLSASGVTGSLLYGPIGFETLEYRAPGMTVSAQRGRIEIERWPLFSRRVVLHRIDVDTIRIAKHSTGETGAAHPPERLHLPVQLALEELHVNRIAFDPGGIAAGPLIASAQTAPESWSAQIRSLRTPIGDASGEMRIATAKPFVLEGSFSLAQKEPAYDGKAQLSGTLDRIVLQASAAAKNASAKAEAILTPFAAGAIEHLAVNARDVDPQYFRARPPSARLTLKLTAERDPTSDRMLGAVQLTNAAPGPLDKDRLPLAQLRGSVRGTPADLALRDLLLDLGDGGRLAGNGRLRHTKLDLDLLAQRVDLQQVHTRLYSTQLIGSIRAKTSQDEQRFTMQLMQKNGSVDASVQVAKNAIVIEQIRAAAAGGRALAHGRIGLEGDKAFALKGTVENFDPARFGKFTPARLNSHFDAHGVLSPILQVKADLQVFDSLVGEMAAAGKIRWLSKGTASPDVAIDLALDVGDTHARATGTAFDPVHVGKLDIQLSLAGNDLAALYRIAGIPLPQTPPYQLSGHLIHYDDTWTFKQFTGKVGESDLAGNFTLDRSGARQMLRGELVSDTLRLEDLGGFIGAPGGPKQRQKHVKGEPLLPNSTLNPAKIRAAEADVKFVGRRIVTDVLRLHRMNAHLRIVNGVLTIDPLEFRMKGGDIVGKVTLDARQSVLAGSTDMQARDFKVERLMPTVQNSKASIGTMQGRAQLNGTGNSVAALLGTANGSITLVMDGGEVSDLMLRLVNLDVQHTIVALLKGNEHVPVRCMIGHFVASHGHLKPQPFILDTEHAKVGMTGDIDLGAERLDLRIASQPKDISLVALRGPIVVRGPISAPTVRPDLTHAITRSLAAVALGIVATPVAALVPFFEVGTEKDANCSAIVTQAKALIDKQPGAGAPSADTDEAKAGEKKEGG